MSRTDKDRPYWVKCNDPSILTYEVHHHERLGRVSVSFFGKVIEHREECVIEESAKSERPFSYGIPCYRETTMAYHTGWQRGPTKESRKGYWGAMRTDENISLRRAAKEYNAAGEIDEDIVLAENHHHSMYGGGWWD